MFTGKSRLILQTEDGRTIDFGDAGTIEITPPTPSLDLLDELSIKSMSPWGASFTASITPSDAGLWDSILSASQSASKYSSSYVELKKEQSKDFPPKDKDDDYYYDLFDK